MNPNLYNFLIQIHYVHQVKNVFYFYQNLEEPRIFHLFSFNLHWLQSYHRKILKKAPHQMVLIVKHLFFKYLFHVMIEV